MTTFVPKGFLRLAEAILVVAEAHDPALWDDNAIPSSEISVWKRIRVGTLYPQALGRPLFRDLSEEQLGDFFQRYLSFSDAMNAVRQELHSANVNASYLIEGLHVLIDPLFWGTDQGAFPFGDGLINVIGADWGDGRLSIFEGFQGERLPVLLPESQVRQFGEKSSPPLPIYGDCSPSDAGSSTFRSGAAGRPSAMQLVLAEVRRRMDLGEPMPSTKSGWAREMETWLKAEHPTAPKLTAKAMTNNPDFTDLYRSKTAPEM